MLSKEELHKLIIDTGIARAVILHEPKIKLTKQTSLLTMMVTVQFHAEWCGYFYDGSLEYKDRGAALNHESELLVKLRIFQEMIAGIKIAMIAAQSGGRK